MTVAPRPMLGTARVSAAAIHDYDIAVRLEDTAQDTADALLEDAEIAARQIINDANDKAAQTLSSAESVAEAKLSAIIAKHGASARDELSHRLMLELAKIQASYAAADSWLADLVVAGVQRVVGTLPQGYAQALIIQQTVADFGERWRLELRTNIAEIDQVRALRDQYPVMFKGISDIAVDPAVQPGMLHLCSDISGVEVAYAARIAALAKTLCNDPAA